MKAINNWDNVKATGDFESLPAGGYICQIMSAKEVNNKNSNGTHLELMLEIADGEYKGFFERDYKAQSGEQKFWRGIMNQNVPNEDSTKYEAQCSFFKRFTDAIEESNPNYQWDFNESGLKGKFCGCVFGEKEKQSQKGTVYSTSYANEIVSVDVIKGGKFKVPALKKLENSSGGDSVGFSFAPIDDKTELPFL